MFSVMWKWKHQTECLFRESVQYKATRTARRGRSNAFLGLMRCHAALLIDGDHNSSQFDWRSSVSCGTAGIALCSACLWQLVLWSPRWMGAEFSLSHRLEACHCGPVAPGKNGADIALTRGYYVAVWRQGIRKFVLVASDSDYTPLVEMALYT